MPKSDIMGWADLPVELLEKIFECVEKRRDMLTLRRVNHCWKSVANWILERRALQMWTRWEPYTCWPYLHTFPEFINIPTNNDSLTESQSFLRELRKEWSKMREYMEWLTLFKNGKLNPFPTNSLYVPSINNKDPGDHPLQDMYMQSILRSCGQYLTSLEIGMMTTHNTEELYNILQKMPNLKALTIEKFWPDFCNGEWKLKRNKNKLSPPGAPPSSPNPKLTHMRIGSKIPGHQDSAQKSHIVEWLLMLYAPHLHSLELREVDNFYVFEKGRESGAFQHLKRLRIYLIYEKVHLSLETGPSVKFPLEHLSIKVGDLGSRQVQQVLCFIDKFASSLLTLHFHYSFLQNEYLIDEEGSPPPIFQKLEKLTVPESDIRQENGPEFNIIRKAFVPRFRNLKTLHILFFTFNRGSNAEEKFKQAATFCEKWAVWQLFPTLETVKIRDLTIKKLN